MIEIVITSSVLIFALMLIRKICWGKISRRLQYSLWILVVIRLFVPASLFTSSWSIMNVAETVGDVAYIKLQNIQSEKDILQAGNNPESGLQSGMEAVQNAVEMSDKTVPLYNNGTGNEGNIVVDTTVSSEILKQEPTRVQHYYRILHKILLIVYLLGVFIISGCILFCNLKFAKRLMSDRMFLGKEGKLNVYLTSCVSSPCLWGVCKPSIYLTEKSIQSQERKHYILFHEMTHYRHGDHIWSVVRILCLVLYWFHPLVWVAAKLSMEDGELACDEGTFVRLGVQNREAYGRTLIEMMTESEIKGKFLYCTTGMINGKDEIKKRIKAIALYKKQVIWFAIPVIIFAVFLGVCTAGSKKEKNADRQNDLAHTDMSEETKIAEDENSNDDVSDRVAVYEVDLTGDSTKEKIVFDVAETQIFIRILEGNDSETLAEDTAEVILEEYVFLIHMPAMRIWQLLKWMGKTVF